MSLFLKIVILVCRLLMNVLVLGLLHRRLMGRGAEGFVELFVIKLNACDNEIVCLLNWFGCLLRLVIEFHF